ncbi:MAG TPA: hypothetical protein VFI42_16905 [Thermomicrobiaceae bacterium]|nr:hypothetical protein [Thermomicrobiaceae bacterium]
MSATLITESLAGILETTMARLLLEKSETGEDASLHPRWALAARAGWLGLILLSLGLFLASLPLRYQQLRDFSFVPLARSDLMRAVDPQALRTALGELGLSTTVFAWFSLTLEVAFAATFCAVAALIAARRDNTWWIKFVVLMMVVFGTSSLPTITALEGTNSLLELLARVTHMLGWALVEIFLLLFPTGRFVPRWTGFAAGLVLVWSLAMALFPASIVSAFAWPDQLAFLLWLVWYGGGMAAQLYRFRHHANRKERWQTKWTLFSVIVAVVGTLAVNVPAIFAPSHTANAAGAFCELIRIPAGALFIMIMPVTVGIAILRYRLWEIDLLISRTLVYLPLTAILGGLYTASISLFQRLFEATTGNSSDAAIVLTTLVVASAFTPVKNALQGAVDGRFKPSGQDNDLRAYRRQLQAIVGVLDMQQAMGHLLELAAASLAARGGAVYLLANGALDPVQTVGVWQGHDEPVVSVPLEWEGMRLGLVALGPKRNGQAYSEADLAELRQAADSLAHLAVLRGGHLQATAEPVVARMA